MNHLFLPAGFLDGVIVFTLLEFVVLVWRHQRTGRGLGPRDLASGLAPGLGLMVALRLADLPQVPWPVVLALARAEYDLHGEGRTNLRYGYMQRA